jgi:hypothetical protein
VQQQPGGCKQQRQPHSTSLRAVGSCKADVAGVTGSIVASGAALLLAGCTLLPPLLVLDGLLSSALPHIKLLP